MLDQREGCWGDVGDCDFGEGNLSVVGEKEREFLRLDVFRLCGRNKKVSLIVDLINIKQ
jgi:hypothetical protein